MLHSYMHDVGKKKHYCGHYNKYSLLLRALWIHNIIDIHYIHYM